MKIYLSYPALLWDQAKTPFKNKKNLRMLIKSKYAPEEFLLI